MTVFGQNTARWGWPGLAALALAACGQSADIPRNGSNEPSPSPEPNLQIVDKAAAPANSNAADLEPGLASELTRLFGPADGEPVAVQAGDSALDVVQRVQP